ncbi:hypothetical protein F383_26016 [Gossypium arboreum]|uniref:Uncharacterized protein n=2 Tax=Gossypium arboreum TaxID=29729 RepID=A0ABR0MQA7_GOSAR|nr:uncharacterized protein LOC108478684 [Gossypium arboreum]KAK5775294.1 hypothetical protein PVK06_043167 [Gossypium arboreum]KHG02664.1 hypothetical protein F383_26016 [Gossypium arboreum]
MPGDLAKTDSEASSLSQSSPPRSPRRQMYYVQSPSRDSHDGEKTTNSSNSTPVLSPTHSQSNSSLGPHSSRESSSTRLSKHHGSRKPRTNKQSWKEFDAIEEEALLDGEAAHHALHRRRCYFLAFLVGFFVLFTTFSLILWGASRLQKPKITMKSISFNEFVVQAGADFSGVSTEMVSMNCTVKLTYRNTATFFGVHVTSTPLHLSYSQLTVATGSIHKFYQSRKSQRALIVMMKGSHIPLYGGGASLASLNGAPTQPVPLALDFMVRSRAYVLGKLVKPKFYKRIQCWAAMDPKKMSKAISLKNKCSYS